MKVNNENEEEENVEIWMILDYEGNVLWRREEGKKWRKSRILEDWKKTNRYINNNKIYVVMILLMYWEENEREMTINETMDILIFSWKS